MTISARICELQPSLLNFFRGLAEPSQLVVHQYLCSLFFLFFFFFFVHCSATFLAPYEVGPRIQVLAHTRGLNDVCCPRLVSKPLDEIQQILCPTSLLSCAENPIDESKMLENGEATCQEPESPDKPQRAESTTSWGRCDVSE